MSWYSEVVVTTTADQIPDGAKVSKINSPNVVVLRKHLKVWVCEETPTSPSDRVTIKATFLIDGAGRFEQIEPSRELQWHVGGYELFSHLQQIFERERNR